MKTTVSPMLALYGKALLLVGLCATLCATGTLSLPVAAQDDHQLQMVSAAAARNGYLRRLSSGVPPVNTHTRQQRGQRELISPTYSRGSLGGKELA